jgi:hypothetical protein
MAQLGTGGGTVQARKVFLSYRRGDSADAAGRLADRLVHDLGKDTIFMDVDGIPLGVDFVKRLTAEVASCDVLLAVIGPRWLEIRDDKGNRRLDNPNDFVRVEISAALERDIPLIPILLNGTQIPSADDLPSNLTGLSVRNGLEVRHSSFHSDLDRLVRQLRRRQTPSIEVERRVAERQLKMERQLQEIRSSAHVGLPQSTEQPVARLWTGVSSWLRRWLERARAIWTEPASASSVSTSGLAGPSAFGMLSSSNDSKIRQILFWAAGTIVGFAISVFCVFGIGGILEEMGYKGEASNGPGSIVLLAIALGLLTALGLFARRLPMPVAAGITTWAAVSGVLGLIVFFRLQDNINLYLALAIPLVIQVLLWLFLRLTKLL